MWAQNHPDNETYQHGSPARTTSLLYFECVSMETTVCHLPSSVFSSKAERKRCQHLISLWQISRHINLSRVSLELTEELNRDRNPGGKPGYISTRRRSQFQLFTVLITFTFSFFLFILFCFPCCMGIFYLNVTSKKIWMNYQHHNGIILWYNKKLCYVEGTFFTLWFVSHSVASNKIRVSCRSCSLIEFPIWW